MLGVIGGTGLDAFEELEIKKIQDIKTPYGEPSSPLQFGVLDGHELVFLPRHGAEHQYPPHLINYRANIWALNHAGVKYVLAFSAVGGITEEMSPGTIVIPDQLIDYTYDRKHTFFESGFEYTQHIEFADPYNKNLRDRVLKAATSEGIEYMHDATYAVTQGPRFETAAEIKKMEQDGCDIVGMTGMPEAALAQELKLPYVVCTVVVNWAAGKTDEVLSIQSVIDIFKKSSAQRMKILKAVLRLF